MQKWCYIYFATFEAGGRGVNALTKTPFQNMGYNPPPPVSPPVPCIYIVMNQRPSNQMFPFTHVSPSAYVNNRGRESKQSPKGLCRVSKLWLTIF